MRKLVVILLTLMVAGFAYAADFTDYQRIAISSPLITQIFTNPEISANEDLQLSPETQIMLYEELAGDICSALNKAYEGKVEFICFNDIKAMLDNDSWNQFNKVFTGQNTIDAEIAEQFGESLRVQAVLNTYLMFNYYANGKTKHNLEIHLEWYLVDSSNGQSAVNDEFDCKESFNDDKDVVSKEAECFKGAIKVFADMGNK